MRRIQKFNPVNNSLPTRPSQAKCNLNSNENIGILRGLLGRLNPTNKQNSFVKIPKHGIPPKTGYNRKSKRSIEVNKTQYDNEYEKLRDTFHLDKNVNKKYVRNVLFKLT